MDDVKQPVRQEIAPRRVRRYRYWIFVTYLVLASLGFGALAFLATLRDYLPFDVATTLSLQAIQAGWFSALMVGVSWFGFPPQSFVMMGALVVGLYALGLRRESYFTLAAGLSSHVLNTLIKFSIQRPRPGADLVQVAIDVSGFSFPSGHVMFYTAFFGFLLFLSFTLLRHSWQRVLLMIFFGGLVALVGPSRIYLGHHWASDVLAAYLIGSLNLTLLVWLYQRNVTQKSSR